MDKSPLQEHVYDVYVKCWRSVRLVCEDTWLIDNIDESTCTGNGTAFMNIFLSIPVQIPAPPPGRPHSVFPY